MKYLFVLNDPAYGTERSYNGLRLAMNLQTQEPESEVSVFLMGDAATCGQKTPDGYYNLEHRSGPWGARARCCSAAPVWTPAR